ncbi:MAG: T9SS type A sorting domain-containing protein [Candidatus Eisenbacteria sp.]|nr:T9SS type A sorting domain-containing protein [Candidatus Eisenbacteria bacterium]
MMRSMVAAISPWNMRWALIGCFAVSWILASATGTWGQPKGPGDISEQLAKAKAEWFARVQTRATEPTPNQENYDAKYYFLDLDIDPVSEVVSGTVRMDAEVVMGPLTTADVDLYDNLTVDGVTSGGSAAAFSHSDDILTVTLDRSYAAGETFILEITYHGTPSASAGAFAFASYGGEDMIWSLSEPFGARTWWPCKDYPLDKPDSADIWITVPDNLIVASNGTLRATIDNGGTMTYQWHEQYPIATYLVSVAIHPYTVFSDWYHYTRDDSMEIQFFVFPAHYAAVQENYAKVKDMIGVYAGLFGEYPFIEEKYGHAEFTWGGGMEHQTITSLGGYGEYLIVHELAHMWWGDMITCDNFHDIWLNEGFAVYSEALWAEDQYGWDEYQNQMAYAKYFGGGTIYVPDLSDWGRIFDFNLTYNKASWVPHMLRGIVGDSTFFEILRTYYGSQYQYGSATTEQFRDVCEQVTGREFDRFFQQWIYEEGFPVYRAYWDYQPARDGYEISLGIDQLQTNVVFQMPIQVTVTTVMGETTLVVEDSLATQQFTLVVDDEPVGLELDRDEWILRMIATEIADATFDRGILVVNGVHWSTYDTQITSAYEDSVFWGSLPISFWDVFDEPGGGYPSNLPPPLGHGTVPADTIKQFSAIVWVGNNYGGDLTNWYETPILSYLEAGGNVLLMTRMGQSFIYDALRSYLGIQWAEEMQNTTRRATAVYPGLVDMPKIDTQSYNAVFDTSSVEEESTVLFVQNNIFDVPRGLGVWREPVDGGTQRESGAQFVFISGRPYRYDHNGMRSNAEFILREFFGEPYGTTAVAGDPVREGRLELSQNFPNPFNPVTTIRFRLPAKLDVHLTVYDVQGREVARLVDGPVDAGRHSVSWAGVDNQGDGVASGVYWYRLEAADQVLTRRMVMLK